MEKAPLPHNKRNCYPPYPDHYLTRLWPLLCRFTWAETESIPLDPLIAWLSLGETTGPFSLKVRCVFSFFFFLIWKYIPPSSCSLACLMSAIVFYRSLSAKAAFNQPFLVLDFLGKIKWWFQLRRFPNYCAPFFLSPIFSKQATLAEVLCSYRAFSLTWPSAMQIHW